MAANTDTSSLGLWWGVPGVLAGMSAPFIHSQRRANLGGEIDAYEDDLPLLWAAGVRAMVCLLNILSDASVYRSAGFDFLFLPIPDGMPPNVPQALEFVRFVQTQRAAARPVLVHCAAGLGRTGTMIAAYLMASQKMDADSAIQRVRLVEPAAIETASQVRFLHGFSPSA